MKVDDITGGIVGGDFRGGMAPWASFKAPSSVSNIAKVKLKDKTKPNRIIASCFVPKHGFCCLRQGSRIRTSWVWGDTSTELIKCFLFTALALRRQM